MAATLAEHYADQKELEKLITIAGLILEYYPKDVGVMIMKANAYYDLSSKYYLEKFRSPADIPDRAKGHYQYLLQNNRLWAANAEALGWHEPRKVDEETYMQSVKEGKNKSVN